MILPYSTPLTFDLNIPSIRHRLKAYCQEPNFLANLAMIFQMAGQRSSLSVSGMAYINHMDPAKRYTKEEAHQAIEDIVSLTEQWLKDDGMLSEQLVRENLEIYMHAFLRSIYVP